MNPFWWMYNNPGAAIANIGWVLILVVPFLLVSVWAFTTNAASIKSGYKNRDKGDGWYGGIFPPLNWMLRVGFASIIVGTWVFLVQFLILLFT
jgi:hypothetical protein